MNVLGAQPERNRTVLSHETIRQVEEHLEGVFQDLREAPHRVSQEDVNLMQMWIQTYQAIQLSRIADSLGDRQIAIVDATQPSGLRQRKK